VASHRADGSAFVRPPAPARGRRRAETPAPPPVGERARRRAAHRQPTGPTWVNHLPQAGVVGVLGVATIVAPLAGDVLPNGRGAAEAQASGHVQAAVPRAVNDFRVIPVEPEVAEVPPSAALQAAEMPTPEELAALRAEADRANRSRERAFLEQQALEEAVPGCSGDVHATDAENGRLDTSDLCELWGTGHLLRADAALSLARLSFAYRDHFGEEMKITDSYRTYASQVRVRALKPGLAARPGTSQHGWGLAVDLGGGVESADEHYAWLRENAPDYGWENPDWARRGGSGPYEPWHWEFTGGTRP
jgi:D-alanyl-D-alanine carboxypeptidase